MRRMAMSARSSCSGVSSLSSGVIGEFPFWSAVIVLAARLRPSFGEWPRPKSEGTARQMARQSLICTPSCEGVAPSGAPSGVLLSASGRAFRDRPDDGRPVSQLLAGSPYWPPGGAPTPPGCVACSPRPRAPARSTRAGATGSRPSWERTTIGIVSHRNIVKTRRVEKNGAGVQ